MFKNKLNVSTIQRLPSKCYVTLDPSIKEWSQYYWNKHKGKVLFSAFPTIRVVNGERQWCKSVGEMTKPIPEKYLQLVSQIF